MGPSSSGSQATVASVVTSTLLAGLGFSGGVLSSFPSSVWPTRTPPSSPTPARQPASKEPTSLQTPDPDSDRQGAPEGEEGERREGEEDDDEGEDGEEARTKKDKMAAGEADVRTKETAARQPASSAAPTPTAKEKEQGSAAAPTAAAENATGPAEESVAPPAWDPENDTLEFQLPDSPTLPAKTGGGEKSHWPFSVHTGETASCCVCSYGSIL